MNEYLLYPHAVEMIKRKQPNLLYVGNYNFMKCRPDIIAIDKRFSTEYELKAIPYGYRIDLDFKHRKHELLLSGGLSNKFYFVLPEHPTKKLRYYDIPEKYGIITYDYDWNSSRELDVSFNVFREAKLLHRRGLNPTEKEIIIN